MARKKRRKAKKTTVAATPVRKKPVKQEASTSTGTSASRNGSPRNRSKKKVLRRTGKSPKVHCMLARSEKELLLLPTSVLAEVMDFQQPAPLDAAPPWLLGQIEWEKRQVPVCNFCALINATDPGENSLDAKIMIIKSLSDSARVPYLGLLLSDLPSMISVEQCDIVETGDDRKSLGVFRRITIQEQEAIIPELDRLTHLVTHAAFGALPITHLDD